MFINSFGLPTCLLQGEIRYLKLLQQIEQSFFIGLCKQQTSYLRDGGKFASYSIFLNAKILFLECVYNYRAFHVGNI